MSTTQQTSAPDWKLKRNHILLWLFVSIFFTLIQIQQSLSIGQLSLPPTYDDVVYFNDALGRLKIFHEGGFPQLISNYVENPPHSPFSTLLAFSGFAIFGIRDWVPAFMNFLIVFIVLIFIDYLTRKLSFLSKLIISLSSLSCLLISHAVIEFRPDIFCGLVTTMTIVLISEKSLSILSSSRRKLLVFLAGISMLIKPTILPVTVVLLCITFIMRLWVDIVFLKERKGIMQVIHNFRVSLFCLVITILPYYLFAWQPIFKYIYQTALFGDYKKIWDLPLHLQERLFYYLTGTGGSMMIGNWIYLWAVLVIVSIFIIISQKNWENVANTSLLLPFITSSLVAYTIVSISDTKSPFLGVIIPCFIFFSSIMMIVFIINYLSLILSKTTVIQITQKISKTIALWGLTIFCLVCWSLYEWPVKNDLVSPPLASLPDGVRAYQANLLRNLYQDISNDSCINNSTKNTNQDESTVTLTNCDKSVYLTLITHWLTPDTLLYYQYKLGITTGLYMLTLKTDYGEFNGGALINDIEDQIRGINEANYTIALDIPNPDIASWLPGLKIAESTLNFLDNNPNFLLLNTYKNPYNNSIVYLYKRD